MVPCPLPFAFVIAVIIDCFRRAYNCFIASNGLNVVTDLIGSSYLRFTYSIPGLSLGHLSFLLQMIWWQCTAIQVFISPANDMVFLLCCHKPEKQRMRGKCFHYCTSRRLCRGVREGRYPKLHHTDMGRCSRGQPHPFVTPGMKAPHHHSHSPVFMQPAIRLLKPVPFPVCILLCRKKHREFYTLLTATKLHIGYVRLCYSVLKKPIFTLGKKETHKIEVATNTKWVTLKASLVAQG